MEHSDGVRPLWEISPQGYFPAHVLNSQLKLRRSLFGLFPLSSFLVFPSLVKKIPWSRSSNSQPVIGLSILSPLPILFTFREIKLLPFIPIWRRLVKGLWYGQNVAVSRLIHLFNVVNVDPPHERFLPPKDLSREEN